MLSDTSRCMACSCLMWFTHHSSPRHTLSFLFHFMLIKKSAVENNYNENMKLKLRLVFFWQHVLYDSDGDRDDASVLLIVDYPTC